MIVSRSEQNAAPAERGASQVNLIAASQPIWQRHPHIGNGSVAHQDHRRPKVIAGKQYHDGKAHTAFIDRSASDATADDKDSTISDAEDYPDSHGLQNHIVPAPLKTKRGSKERKPFSAIQDANAPKKAPRIAGTTPKTEKASAPPLILETTRANRPIDSRPV
jgi:hypothetical protein